MDLRTYRKREGLTLDDMAGRLGVTAATVQRWEAGKINLPVTQAAKIEEATAGAVTASDLAAVFNEANAPQAAE